MNALGANQREHASAMPGSREPRAESREPRAESREPTLRADADEVATELRGFRRSNEESLAELKDLSVGLRHT